MEKRNLAQQTADSLYARIVNGGAWGPGDRLPNENDLAEQLGVSRQSVSKWETGTADPSTSNLLALAKLFGVSAEELLRQVDRTDAEEN